MSADQINQFVRSTVPSLTPGGFYNRPEVFGEEEARQVGMCLRWLDLFAKPTRGIRTKYSSYYLKHAVERWGGKYIGNGCFIAACVIAGYRYRVCNTLNAHFNIAIRKGAGGVL